MVKKAKVERREAGRKERSKRQNPKEDGGRLELDARRTTSKPPSSAGRHTYPGHPTVPDDTTDSTYAVGVEARQRPAYEYSTALRDTHLLKALRMHVHRPNGAEREGNGGRRRESRNGISVRRVARAETAADTNATIEAGCREE
jgi:hypothetical protein